MATPVIKKPATPTTLLDWDVGLMREENLKTFNSYRRKEKRFEYRQKESKPILNQLQKWLEKSLATVKPKTKLGEALTYLNNQWDRLVGFLNNGEYPIDNNVAERAIRPFAIGRKNWLFSHSQAGAKASANLYSIISTAKANGLNAYDYLERIFKELPNTA
jgi:transposase